MKKTAAVVTGAILALGLAGPAFADSEANGAATHSPGVLSGNVVQVPIHIPINICGNTINIVALLNPAAGNTCINGDIHKK
ncbi:chaplin [Streptomyces sp. Ru62]|uniref:chaplin n=1 Tax=Streptomyces sp. Ru62 TaxID=2080745 RepID=UPI000CDDD22E|nr:chaplin [Streptomyces sp. Ru62]POX64892.1 chaplin [Streptomyces sp. Ru62]